MARVGGSAMHRQMPRRPPTDSFELEHAVAESQKSRVELRDEQGTYSDALGFPGIDAVNTVSSACKVR